MILAVFIRKHLIYNVICQTKKSNCNFPYITREFQFACLSGFSAREHVRTVSKYFSRLLLIVQMMSAIQFYKSNFSHLYQRDYENKKNSATRVICFIFYL